MNNMFQYVGYNAMTSLDLGTNFDTSNVTDMSAMFDYAGYNKMATLNLGDKFNTAQVTNMEGMFRFCGYSELTALNLGNHFYTSKGVEMGGMFQALGVMKLTSLDLGQNFDTSNKYIKYRIEVIVNSQNTENNTSNITVRVWFFRTNQGYSTYGSGTCYCNINSESYSQSITPSQRITSSPIVLFEKSATISHENDGTKSLWVSAYIRIMPRLQALTKDSPQGFREFRELLSLRVQMTSMMSKILRFTLIIPQVLGFNLNSKQEETTI